MRNRPGDFSPMWERKKELRAALFNPNHLPAGPSGGEFAPSGSGSMTVADLKVKRATDGEYVVTAPNGKTIRIYRDPESSMWYRVSRTEHFSRCFVGFNKQDALTFLTTRGQQYFT